MERRWFSQSQPQTLQMAVMLLYLISALTLIQAVVFGGIGWFLLLPIAGQVLGAFGIANDSKGGYRVAIFFPALTVGWTIYLLARYHHGVSFGTILTFMTYAALLALLLHQQSREYAKVWFR